jgi:alginate O-acetyltransferase complex protein AlgJ
MMSTGLPTPTAKAPPAKQPDATIPFRLVLSRVLAVVYVAALFVPLLGTWRHWDPGGQFQENRRLSPPPEFPINYNDVVVYADQWLNFYRDHFGFRNTLIRAVAIARLRGLAEDFDGHVLIGKKGWLFYRPDGDPDLLAFRGLNPLSEAQLDAWQQLLERRNAALSARGIAFLVVIPPDKQTIYPEFLPDSAAVLVPRSHLDQIIDRFRRTHSRVRIVDLRPALMAAKASALLYYKTDSHWNDLGAYCAYRAIIDALNQIPFKWRFTPQPRADFIARSSLFARGDLAMITHTSRQFTETSFTLTPKILSLIPPVAEKPGGIVINGTSDSTLPRLVLIRDSFARALILMLGPHFNRPLYDHQTQEIDPDLYEQEKPDIVIDEFVERFLYGAPPVDPGRFPALQP